MVSRASTDWDFLRWALPRAGLRVAGYRRVRRQVLRRIRARLRELELRDLMAYRTYLEQNPPEWSELRYCCRVTVSRFFRDRHVFDALASTVLPEMVARGTISDDQPLRAWSGGCASGEEAYTVAIVAREVLGPEASLEVLGTDVDPYLLRRATAATYRVSSLREVPRNRRSSLFSLIGDTAVLLTHHRGGVRFERRGILDEPPPGRFQLILCRNLLFTYFDAEKQARGLELLLSCLPPGGALVVGRGEQLSALPPDLRAWPEAPLTYRKLTEE